MRSVHGLCGAAGDGRWAGGTRRWANRGYECPVRPRKRPKWLVVRQDRSTKGGSGNWLEELGVRVSVCECVCACGKGREKWPQKLAMTTGFI